jgi:hypothetical protein
MSDEIEIPLKVSLPLDNGFLRRECPRCLRQFKWWHGRHPTRPPDAEDPSEYHCPYCNATAGPKSWYTQAQIELIRVTGLRAAQEMIHEHFDDVIRDINRSGIIQAELQSGQNPEMQPLDEPPDMHMVESPCHPYEPTKVEDDWQDPLFCIVCGQAFVASQSG